MNKNNRGGGNGVLNSETVQQMILVPRALRRQVVESANENQRSISAEFRYAMVRWLREQELQREQRS
jgi:hypothetical protein